MHLLLATADVEASGWPRTHKTVPLTLRTAFPSAGLSHTSPCEPLREPHVTIWEVAGATLQTKQVSLEPILSLKSNL